MSNLSKLPPVIRYLIGVLIVLAVSLAIFMYLMKPAAADFGWMSSFF